MKTLQFLFEDGGQSPIYASGAVIGDSPYQYFWTGALLILVGLSFYCIVEFFKNLIENPPEE